MLSEGHIVSYGHLTNSLAEIQTPPNEWGITGVLWIYFEITV